MKTALNGIAALSLWAFLLAGNAWAEAGSAPAPETATQPFPGIIVTPPGAMPQMPASGERAPPAEAQPQSCPATGSKLELVS